MKIQIIKSGTSAKKQSCACDFMVDSPLVNKQ
jgi:hypothetical protein